MAFRIFLTHSEKNHQVVAQLAGQLVTQGFTPVMAKDVRPVEFPQALSQKVRQEIQGSDCVIAVITPEAVDSPWVNQEIGFALGKVPLIPLVEPGINPLKLAFLQGAQFVWLNRDKVAESVATILDWAKHLKGKKDAKRELLIAAGVGALVGVLVYLAVKNQSTTAAPAMPTPAITPGP